MPGRRWVEVGRRWIREWEAVVKVQSGLLGGDSICMADFSNAFVNIPLGRRLGFCNSTLFLCSSVLWCFLLVPFLFYCLFFKCGHPPGFHFGLLFTLPWEDHAPFRYHPCWWLPTHISSLHFFTEAPTSWVWPDLRTWESNNNQTCLQTLLKVKYCPTWWFPSTNTIVNPNVVTQVYPDDPEQSLCQIFYVIIKMEI